MEVQETVWNLTDKYAHLTKKMVEKDMTILRLTALVDASALNTSNKRPRSTTSELEDA
jgi:hypothetical protein